MSIKNAVKNLVSHFGLVWSMLVYYLLFAALITGLSLPFIMPVMRELSDAGVFTELKAAYDALFGEGGFTVVTDTFYEAYQALTGVFTDNDAVAALTVWFFVLIVVIAFRFFLGLHEIPMMTVIDGAMSCNCIYGFGGKFFSTLWLSVRYSFAKLLVTVLIDAVIGGIAYGIILAVGNNWALPFVLTLVMVVLSALRSTLLSCWASCIVNEGHGVARGFFRAAKIAFRNFGAIYSMLLVSILIMLSLGAFITLFTLGVGMIIILPLFSAYTGYLNATMYYNKLGKRYYVDGDVFTPIIKENSVI